MLIIYPYWFETLEKCKKELPPLLNKPGFLFNLNNIDVCVDSNTNEVLGIICSYKNDDNLDFDYTQLEQHNDRYNFTIENYIKKVIDEIKKANYAYISNVCVHENARGLGIAGLMLNYIKEKYKKSLITSMQLDVLADNVSAINAYQKNDFQIASEIFEGFSDPSIEKPDVVSMRSKF